MACSRNERDKILQEEHLRKVPVLVFANKQDLPGALQPAEIAEGLGLLALKDRAWQIQGCEATNGTGLDSGMSWVLKQIG